MRGQWRRRAVLRADEGGHGVRVAVDRGERHAAQQIGDDTLQRKTQGFVVPDSFNHGTSAQRVEWFGRGVKSGKLEDCDTFNADL